MRGAQRVGDDLAHGVRQAHVIERQVERLARALEEARDAARHLLGALTAIREGLDLDSLVRHRWRSLAWARARPAYPETWTGTTVALVRPRASEAQTVAR